MKTMEEKLSEARENRLRDGGELATMEPGQPTLAQFNSGAAALQATDPIKYALVQRQIIVDAYKTLMVLDQDYGRVQGCGNKPMLFKAGAEKAASLFGYSIGVELVKEIEDWENEFFSYTYRATIRDRGNRPLAQCEGNCNSKESKYRWRRVYDNKVNKQQAQQYEDAGYQRGNGFWRVPNDDICSQVNTLMKMSQKRCLGSTTALLFKTSRGLVRSDCEGLFDCFSKKGDTKFYLPGVDGSWREIMGIAKEQHREIFRIEISDGSYIRATNEHRFPTASGLKHVHELIDGDILLRSQIKIDNPGRAEQEIAFICGLFIAEGNYPQGNGCRFTINGNRQDLIDRITALADRLGATYSQIKKDSNCYQVDVYGPALTGVIRNFVEGDKGENKHFSKQLWRQGREFIAEALKGYLEGDGSYTESKGRNPFWRIGFTGKNRNLATDLRCAANLLGFRVQIKRTTTKCDGKTFPAFVGWIKPNIETYNQKSLCQVTSINKETKLGTVYDIEVDGDHLFCLADGIQTHNSIVGAVLIATNTSAFFGNAELESKQDFTPSDDRPQWDTIDAEVVQEDRFISEPQRRRLWAIATQAGHGEASLKALLATYGITSTKKIPAAQYEVICTQAGDPALAQFYVAQTEPSEPTPALDDA